MIDNKKIAEIRRSYAETELTKSSVKEDPFEQLKIWLHEAIESNIIEANAFVVSTANSKGESSSRVVLLKSIEHDGLTFFTNYESRKGKDLKENPFAAGLFFWRELGRQIKFSGKVEKVSHEESERYFETRPVESRLSAWASQQSEVIPDRTFLKKRVEELREKYSDGNIPLPPYWGGFKIKPVRFEFWQGRENRLHDRVCYLKKEENWEIVRLAP